MNFKDTILLTGAGFTVNLGGFLAKQMWAEIFNNPILESSNMKKLKDELKNGSFDFEEIYSRIIENPSSFTPEERSNFQGVVNHPYLAMDGIVQEASLWETYGIHPADLKKFLGFFSKDENGKVGACFTLNQDLFMERHLEWHPLGPSSLQNKGLDNDKLLPTGEQLETFKASITEQFSFIKLHGSLRWVTQDGDRIKIIGVNKERAIEKVPLLKWYFELFKHALNRDNVKLVIIGYGFKDDHINKLLVDAINGYGLKLYILTAEDPGKFYFRMTHKYPSSATVNDLDTPNKVIWKSVCGYFQYPLKDVFPYAQRMTAQKKEIYQALGIPH